MKRYILRVLAVVVFVFVVNPSYPIQYGDSVTISIVTCSPGEEVYAKFGHTALRIRDQQGRDLVYNYGIFDFNTSNFYLKFLRGHTDYLLGVYPTSIFLEEYRERNSTVWEQELNLLPSEKQALIKLLKTNYEPENRIYRYNFAFDNCATRPMVKIQEALHGILVFESPYANETYRNLINNYIDGDGWTHLGINLMFGAAAEKKVSHFGTAFLPEILKLNLDRATILSFDRSTSRKLVSDSRVIVGPSTRDNKHTFWLFHPFTLTLLLFLLGAYQTFRKYKTSKSSKLFDSFLFGIVGLAGLLIGFLTFFSEHALVGQNWNLLWMSPLNLVLVPILWKRSLRKYVFYYLSFYLLLLLTFAAIVASQLQVVPFAIFPLVALLVMRTARRIVRLCKKLFESTAKGWKWKKTTA